VLDLFGTVVAAPTAEERARAAFRLAFVVGCDAGMVEHYFRSTWHVRHDGSLPTFANVPAVQALQIAGCV
jgi:putative hydrolase of the HAD superfamily